MPEKIFSKEPRDPLIPVGFLAQFMADDSSLPNPGAILGYSAEDVAHTVQWATQSELDEELEALPSGATILNELRQDATTMAIVEAFTQKEASS